MLRAFRAWKVALLEARARRHPVAGVLWSFAHGGEGQEGSGEYREDQGDREEPAMLQGCREDQGDREEPEGYLEDQTRRWRVGTFGFPREEDDGNHKEKARRKRPCFKDGGVHGGHASENRSGRSVSDGEHRYRGVHRKCQGDHDGDDGDDDGGVHQQYRGDRAGDDGDHEGDGVDERDGGERA